MTNFNKRMQFDRETLYKRRICLGLNQGEIAKKIKRTKNAVSQWELGKCSPNPRSVFLLARALKVKPEFFFNVQS